MKDVVETWTRGAGRPSASSRARTARVIRLSAPGISQSHCKTEAGLRSPDKSGWPRRTIRASGSASI